MFILKVQVLKLKHSKYDFENSQVKMAGFERSGHVNSRTKALLQPCLHCTRAALA
jgi:hypothetical protein